MMLIELSWPARSFSLMFESQVLPSLLAKARTSPEGENPTVCTHPPAGLLYTPQTVLKGSFEPHTVGAGLNLHPDA